MTAGGPPRKFRSKYSPDDRRGVLSRLIWIRPGVAQAGEQGRDEHPRELVHLYPVNLESRDAAKRHRASRPATYQDSDDRHARTPSSSGLASDQWILLGHLAPESARVPAAILYTAKTLRRSLARDDPVPGSVGS